MAAVFNPGNIYISMDSGVTWSPRPSLATVNCMGVACSADASTMVVAASPSQLYVSAQATTTTPGTAGYLSGTRLSAVELEYVGGGVFMPVTFVGTVRPH
jgi:hypothetical protein